MDLKDFQSLIFSSIIDTQLVRTKINELNNSFSSERIDYQLIVSFSLNYERIPILFPFLSKSEINKNQLIHYDQDGIIILDQNPK